MAFSLFGCQKLVTVTHLLEKKNEVSHISKLPGVNVTYKNSARAIEAYN